MKYSIITPVYAWSEQKEIELLRCIESIKNLQYNHKQLEHIVVNDGSTVDLRLPNYPWLKVLTQANMQRLIAINTGLQASTGEWICFLDSDDEYKPNYLKETDKMMKKYPDYLMFNFGCTYVQTDDSITERDAFEPKELPVGHEIFGGGNVVKGCYMFKRSIYEDLGGFPRLHIKDIDCSEVNYGGVRDLWMTSPYDFSAYAQLKFPELRQYFMVDHENEPNKIIKELGNPFGDDYYLFYKFTRKYHSKAIKGKYLLTVHIRRYANP